MTITKTQEEKRKAYRAQSNSVKVFAPATVTNVGCGFDVLGFALREPGEIIELSPADQTGIHLEISGTDAELIPVSPEKNTAGVPLQKLMKDYGIKEGISLKITKSYGIGSGLGSSAASAVGAVLAMNHLYRLGLSHRQILEYAMHGERLTSGNEVHLDNLAAALFGGFIFIHKEPLEFLPLPIWDDLHILILHPQLNLKTSVMRSILKPDISLKQAVIQWSNLGAFLIAWYNKDIGLLRRSMKDVIVEPIRGRVIPEFNRIQQTALDGGAIGCSISGSGPSIFAFVLDMKNALGIKEEWESIMQQLGISYDIFLTRMSAAGAHVIE